VILEKSPAQHLLAVGDGVNDLDMLAWASRSVAMGHAPAIVRSAADQTTGTIDQAGALAVLASLVPTVDGSLSPLAAQIATAEQTAPGPVVLRVWHDVAVNEPAAPPPRRTATAPAQPRAPVLAGQDSTPRRAGLW
jgi:hypothetical protein